jgi:hypothetical protein
MNQAPRKPSFAAIFVAFAPLHAKARNAQPRRFALSIRLDWESRITRLQLLEN